MKEGGESVDPWEYARCIDCVHFGNHGAFCDLQDRQELCFQKACVFFRWKKEKTLRHMDPVYFFPNYEDYWAEMELRGMELRRNYNR